MSLLSMLLILLFQLLFAAGLMVLGYKLFSVHSYAKHLAEYKKHPKNFGWFEHYFLGWRLWNVWSTEVSIKLMGDAALSMVCRGSGVFLMALSAVSFVYWCVWFVSSVI